MLVRSAEDVLLCVMMWHEGDEAVASHLLGYGVKLIKKYKAFGVHSPSFKTVLNNYKR